MASLLVRGAEVLGKATGTYQRARATAFRGKRPPFFQAWQDEGRWRQQGGSEYQAQRRALQNSWVFTAISFIAREVAAAKFEVLEYTSYDEEPTAIPNHPLEEVVRRPNPHMGQAFMWEFTTWWLQLSGNGYWYIGLDEEGEVAELWPIPAGSVEPVPGEGEGSKFVDHYEYTVGGKQYDIPAEYIVHFKLPNPFDIFRGMSRLVAAILPADTDLAMSRWNAGFFGRDNVMPSAIINISSGDPEVPIDPADAQALKDDLKSEYQAFRRKTAVVSAAKLEVETLGWSPRDLDFTAGREFTENEIFKVYGVPPGMLDKDATYANSSNAEMIFNNKTLYPLLVLMAEQLTVELVWRYYGDKLLAGFEDVRRTNREQELSEISAAGPYLTIDEVRSRYWKLDPLADDRGILTMIEAQAQTMGEGFEEGMGFEGEGELEAGLDGNGREPDGRMDDGGEGRERELAYEETDARQQKQERDDVRRWRTKAVNAVKRGRPLPLQFRSTVIPPFLKDEVAAELTLLEAWRAANGTAPSQLMAGVKSLFEEVLLLYPFEVAGATKAPKGKNARPWERWERRLYGGLRRFLGQEAARMAALVEEHGPGILEDEELWAAHRQGLFSSLVERFTGLAKLGATHGRAKLSKRMQAAVDWDLTNRQAEEWARQNAAELVTNITNTTRTGLRDIVGDWAAVGGTLSDLTRSIGMAKDEKGRVLFGVERARMISATEATGAYAQGNDTAWTAAGVEPAVFLPPLHPNCRCYTRPHRTRDGIWVVQWLTVGDERVCTRPSPTPWGMKKGCKAMHRLIVSGGKWSGRRL